MLLPDALLMQVFVEPLAKLELVPLHADVEVGHALLAPLQAYFTRRETGEYIAFTDCSLLPLEISMEKRGVFVLAEGGMMGQLQKLVLVSVLCIIGGDFVSC